MDKWLDTNGVVLLICLAGCELYRVMRGWGSR